jgi:hypothetical protein
MSATAYRIVKTVADGFVIEGRFEEAAGMWWWGSMGWIWKRLSRDGHRCDNPLPIFPEYYRTEADTRYALKRIIEGQRVVYVSNADGTEARIGKHTPIKRKVKKP